MTKLLTEHRQLQKMKNFLTVFSIILIASSTPERSEAGRVRQISTKTKVSPADAPVPARSAKYFEKKKNAKKREHILNVTPLLAPSGPPSEPVSIAPSAATPGADLVIKSTESDLSESTVPFPTMMPIEIREQRLQTPGVHTPPTPATPSDELIERRASTPATMGDLPGVGIREPRKDASLACLKGSNYFLPRESDIESCSESRKRTYNLPGGGTAKLCRSLRGYAGMQGSVLFTRNGTDYILRANGRVERTQPGCNTTTGAFGLCLIPFISVAADPAYHTAGDIIDVPELAGTMIPTPDGTGLMPHPGYFIVADTGGRIKGQNRFDFFIGMYEWQSRGNPFGPHGAGLNDSNRCVKGHKKIQSDAEQAPAIYATIDALIERNGNTITADTHGGDQ